MTFDHYNIRLLEPSDLDSFFNLVDRNRPRLEAFLPGTVARTRTKQDAENYLIEIIAKASIKTYLPYAIIDNTNNAFVGFVDIKNIDWNIPKGEVGFFIDEKWENKKLSSRAFAAFISYCFSELGFNKLFLRTHESNLPAKKLAEKCGFKVEGILRKDYKTTEGLLVDLIYYGKIAEP